MAWNDLIWGLFHFYYPCIITGSRHILAPRSVIIKSFIPRCFFFAVHLSLFLQYTVSFIFTSSIHLLLCMRTSNCQRRACIIYYFYIRIKRIFNLKEMFFLKSPIDKILTSIKFIRKQEVSETLRNKFIQDFKSFLFILNGLE